MCFHSLHLVNLYYDSSSVDLQKSILLKRNKEQKKSWKCILFTHVEIVRDLVVDKISFSKNWVVRMKDRYYRGITPISV